ncbi:RhoGEF domain containing protein [Balamuthia mandrillaris]
MTEQKRSKIIQEIFDTETSYVNSLHCLIKIFLEPLREQVCNASHKKLAIELSQVRTIFSDVETLHAFNSDLLAQLRQNLRETTSVAAATATEPPPTTKEQKKKTVGEIFLAMGNGLKLYTSYINNFDAASETLKSGMRDDPSFKAWVENTTKEHKEELQNLDLRSLLIMPIQRIPRYVLLLQDLVRHTDGKDPDYGSLCQAVARMKEMAEFVDHKKQEVENLKRLAAIQQSIHGLKTKLIQPHRRLVREGVLSVLTTLPPSSSSSSSSASSSQPLSTQQLQQSQQLQQPQLPQLLLSKQKRFAFFLFNDILIICKVKDKTTDRKGEKVTTQKYIYHRLYPLTHVSLHTEKDVVLVFPAAAASSSSASSYVPNTVPTSPRGSSSSSPSSSSYSATEEDYFDIYCDDETEDIACFRVVASSPQEKMEWIIDLTDSLEELKQNWKVEKEPVSCRGKQPPAIADGAVAAHASSLYFFGGMGEEDTCYNDLWVLDTERNEWTVPTVVGTIPSARYAHTLTCIPSSSSSTSSPTSSTADLYVLGGYDTALGSCCCLSDVSIYHTSSATWTKVKATININTTTHLMRMNHSATLVGDHSIFVFGGRDNVIGDLYNDLLVFDTEKLIWTKPKVKGETPPKMYGHSATLIGNKIYLIGGHQQNPTQKVYILNTAKLQWSSMQPRLQPFASVMNHAAILFRGHIVFLTGGVSCDFSESHNVSALLAAQLSWMEPSRGEEEEQSLRRHSCMAARVGDYIWIYGGHTLEQQQQTRFLSDLVKLKVALVEGNMKQVHQRAASSYGGVRSGKIAQKVLSGSRKGLAGIDKLGEFTLKKIIIGDSSNSNSNEENINSNSNSDAHSPRLKDEKKANNEEATSEAGLLVVEKESTLSVEDNTKKKSKKGSFMIGRHKKKKKEKEQKKESSKREATSQDVNPKPDFSMSELKEKVKLRSKTTLNPTPFMQQHFSSPQHSKQQGPPRPTSPRPALQEAGFSAASASSSGRAPPPLPTQPKPKLTLTRTLSSHLDVHSSSSSSSPSPSASSPTTTTRPSSSSTLEARKSQTLRFNRNKHSNEQDSPDASNDSNRTAATSALTFRARFLQSKTQWASSSSMQTELSASTAHSVSLRSVACVQDSGEGEREGERRGGSDICDKTSTLSASPSSSPLRGHRRTRSDSNYAAAMLANADPIASPFAKRTSHHNPSSPRSLLLQPQQSGSNENGASYSAPVISTSSPPSSPSSALRTRQQHRSQPDEREASSSNNYSNHGDQSLSSLRAKQLNEGTALLLKVCLGTNNKEKPTMRRKKKMIIVERDIRYDHLVAEIADLHGGQQRLRLKYLDEERELVCLNDPGDWEIALQTFVARRWSPALEIFCEPTLFTVQDYSEKRKIWFKCHLGNNSNEIRMKEIEFLGFNDLLATVASLFDYKDSHLRFRDLHNILSSPSAASSLKPTPSSSSSLSSSPKSGGFRGPSPSSPSPSRRASGSGSGLLRRVQPMKLSRQHHAIVVSNQTELDVLLYCFQIEGWSCLELLL